MNRLKKSILSLLVAIIVLISIIAIVGAKTTNSIGDINADGTVSAADARLALRASVGLEKLTDTQFKSADVNNDSKVTAADARTILRVSVGLDKFDIQENTENKDNSADSYLSTKNVQDMHKVQKSIEQLMMTEEFQNMEESKKIKLIIDTLEKLEKNGLIERNSIDYNETSKVINYNHICGISGGISVKQEKTYSDSRLNPIGSTDNEIVANYTRQSNSIQKNKSSTNSVLMYGYDDVNKNESLFNSWKSLCEEKTALNTTIFACPTVYDFKTALLNQDFICIFEHGNYGGFIEDTYVFAIMNEEVTEEKNLAYNTDLYFERIISRTNDKGETNYYITPKFFEFYYKDKLTDAIVYLLSCHGFGKDSIVDYGIADVLIQECGAKTVLGFHNEVAQAYGAEIYDNITNLLLIGFTIGDAYDYTIEKLGKSDYTFIKEYLYKFEDMSIRREWLEAANDKKENGAATFLLIGDKSITLFASSTITGTVTDSETGNPISNVTVEVIDNESGSLEPVATATTNTNGKYSLELPYGSYSLSFNHENYEYYGTSLSVSYEAYEENATLHPKGNSDDTGERTVIDSGDCGADGDNVTWTLYGDGELVISGSGEMEDYRFYDKVPWYPHSDIIDSIMIKNGVTSIATVAFNSCFSVRSIKIPASVKCINYTSGCFAFPGSAIFEKIEVDESNQYYSSEDGILFDKDKTTLILCPSGNRLINYNIPNSVNTICASAFSYCVYLTSVKMTDSVKSIEEHAFDSCRSLKQVYLGSNIKNIGCLIFEHCSELKEIIITSNIENSQHCMLTYYKNGKEIETYAGAFGQCYIDTVTISQDVIIIPEYLFANAEYLKSVNIPINVESIGQNAFYDCNQLENIVIENPKCLIYDSAETIDNNATIYGYKNSTAQNYAEKYGRTFVALD